MNIDNLSELIYNGQLYSSYDEQLQTTVSNKMGNLIYSGWKGDLASSTVGLIVYSTTPVASLALKIGSISEPLILGIGQDMKSIKSKT